MQSVIFFLSLAHLTNIKFRAVFAAKLGVCEFQLDKSREA